MAQNKLLHQAAMNYYFESGCEVISTYKQDKLLVAVSKWSQYFYVDIHHPFWLQKYNAFYTSFLTIDGLTGRGCSYDHSNNDYKSVPVPSPILLKRAAIPLLSELLFSSESGLRTLYLTLMKEQQ